jgi:Carboxypeptidase regulatory-like domain
MQRGALRYLCALLLVVTTGTLAHAQSSTSLSGIVTDAAGGVIPGATVVVKNDATGVTFDAVSNSAGQFSFPALVPGTYTVTVSLTGFKTFVATNVRLLAARPGNVNATLEIGDLAETVEVKAGSELVQTQSSEVSSTLSVEQLANLPLNSRNSLYAVALLPGVATTGGPRGAVINGLPNNTVNITVDGVTTGNMLQSGDGFFSMVTPRMDAVEEITVTGAVPGSGSGAGSVQVQFVTRSGSNTFSGSGYHYYRSPDLNSNYYFNKVNELDKNNVIVHQYGGRVGGPIVIPGLLDGRNKAFFFFNFEHQHQPTEATRTRTFLRDSAMNGVFSYASGGFTRSVDLMALARANGQIATFDPTVQSLLTAIQQGTSTTGTVNDLGDPLLLQYVYQSAAKGDQYAPTSRVDFNLSDRHRLSGTYMWQRFKSLPDLLNNRDPRFPGLPNVGSQNSYRTVGSSTLRSTLGANLVNELRGGWQWSPNDFFSNVTADQFSSTDGLAILFPNNTGTGPVHTTSPAPRNTTTWDVVNTLSWLRGSHSFTMGGSYAGINNRLNGYTVVPNIQIGFDTNTDPAAGMFSTANFPGASGGNLTAARNLYALLTGRVSSIPGTARLDSNTGKYVYNGDLAQISGQSHFAAFIQDAWRVSSTFTVNAGLRWDLHEPFTAVSRTFSLANLDDACGISGIGSGPGGRPCNLFQPGVMTGTLTPTFDFYEPGSPAYNANYTDFAPNVGMAWRPNVQDGWLRTLLGDPEQATVRAGYSLSYNQERIDRFTANIGANAGGAVTVTRNLTTGYPLVLPGESHPVLVSQRDRLGPPDFPESPVYPIEATTANDVNIFPEDLRTPRVHSYSVGFQRSIGRDMAIEVRYVGNQNSYTWAEENWNEVNILTNGFLDEFRTAQANLRANIAAGRGNTFAYTGAPGTAPLPIHLAYMQGSSDSGNPNAYTASNFRNSAFLNRFSLVNPEVEDAAEAIDNTSGRANALRAGFPRNFFVLNPSVNDVEVVQDKNWTKFNSAQVEIRRRLSQGLLVSGSYTYGIRKASSLQTLHRDRIQIDNTNVPHAFKVNWYWEVPVGRGRRFGTDMHPILDGILGNWEFSGNARTQTQRYTMVDVKLEGMTVEELQKEFKIRTSLNASGLTQVFSFPQDIIDNTIRAFNVDATSATGYSTALGPPTGRYIRPASDPGCIYIYRGDCGTRDIHLNGPLFNRVDMKVTKKFPIGGRANIEIAMEVLNAFDNVNFNHSTDFDPDDDIDTFRVTSGYTDINTTFDPGGRIGQLLWRINW